MDLFTLILFNDYIEIKECIDSLKWYEFIKKKELLKDLDDITNKITELNVFELCSGLINYVKFNDDNVIYFESNTNKVFMYSYGVIEFIIYDVKVLYNSKFNSFNIVYNDANMSSSYEISEKTILSSVRDKMWTEICADMVDIILAILPEVRNQNKSPDGE